MAEQVSAPSGLKRLARYSVVRLLTLAAMVVISVYLTTLIANMGGFVDEIIRSDTSFAVGMAMRGDEYAKTLTAEQRAQLMEETVDAILIAQGMDQPFLLRTVRWTSRALTLNWGESKMRPIQFGGRSTRAVRAYVLDRLPRTLLLFGLANLLLFFVSIGVALALTHAQGGWLDRLIIVFSPLSSAPPWVYGILLTVLAIQLPGFTFITASFDNWPSEFQWSYVSLILRHMLLPTVSILLSKFFQSVFVWRTLFLLHYDEDWVDLAKAKGLPRRLLERRHILRPSLPAVLTSFVLLLTSLWQEVIVLEYFFNVAGIGRLFIQALNIYDTPMILAIVVLFAYLLALTVFVLDIAYALIDPRVRIGGEVRLRTQASQRARWRLVRPRWAWRPRWPDLSAWVRDARDALYTLGHTLRRLWRDLARYPAGVVGLAIIVFMIGVAIYAVMAIPYPQAVALWRGDQRSSYRQPKNALPAWVDALTRDSLPRTLILDSRADPIPRQVTAISPEQTDITLTFPFEYTYDRFRKS